MKNFHPNLLFTKVTILMSGSLIAMADALINPGLTAIQDHFALIPNAEILVRLILTLPSLLVVIASPVAGMIADRLGRKPLLIIATLLYGFAGGSEFFHNSLYLILVERAFLGLSVAGIMVSSTTLIADYYTGNDRNAFMGLQSAFMAFGAVIFLGVGGVLASSNWRYPFLIYLSSWLLLPLIIFYISEPDHSNSETTLEEQTTNVKSSIPFRLLTLIFGISIISRMIFYLIPVNLPFYLDSLHNATPTQTGVAIATCTLLDALSSMIYGFVVARLGKVSILSPIFVLMGIGNLIIGSVSDYSLILIGLGITGLGLGLLMPHLNVWVSEVVPSTMRGRAIGGLSTCIFLGQFISPIVSQPVSQNLGLAFTYSLAGGIFLFMSIVFYFTNQHEWLLKEKQK